MPFRCCHAIFKSEKIYIKNLSALFAFCLKHLSFILCLAAMRPEPREEKERFEVQITIIFFASYFGVLLVIIHSELSKSFLLFHEQLCNLLHLRWVVDGRAGRRASERASCGRSGERKDFLVKLWQRLKAFSCHVKILWDRNGAVDSFINKFTVWAAPITNERNWSGGDFHFPLLHQGFPLRMD